MRGKYLYIGIFFLSVVSGVLSKEKTATQDEPDYQDATIPEDYKKVSQSEHDIFVPDSLTPGSTTVRDSGTETSAASTEATRSAGAESSTSYPGGARASRVDSSSARNEKVEDSTTKAPEAVENMQGKHGHINNSTGIRKHTTIDPVSVKLLRGERNGILATDVALSKPILYFNYSHAEAYSVDYHYAKKFLFFTALDTIFRDEVVGRLTREKSPKVVVSSGVDGPVSLAVDWVHDRIYWMSNRHQTVEVADLDGGNRTLLLDNLQNIRYPNNIDVDPYAGYLFLVSNYSMYRADLDGANLTRLQLRGEDVRGVKCFALDLSKGRIYYSGKEGDPETGTPYIASCDYEGEHCHDHNLAYKWNDIFSMDVFRDTMYFAHYSRKVPDTLYSVDLNAERLTPKRLQSTDPFNEGIWSIKVYHPEVQKDPKQKNCDERKDNQKSGA